jgi:hypothetical protein
VVADIGLAKEQLNNFVELPIASSGAYSPTWKLSKATCSLVDKFTSVVKAEAICGLRN